MIIKIFKYLLYTLLFLSAEAIAQTTENEIKVRGTIKDSETNETIPYALVTIISMGKMIVNEHTNLEGQFSLKFDRKELINGAYVLKVEALGYKKNITSNIMSITGHRNFNIELFEEESALKPPYHKRAIILINKYGEPEGKTFNAEELRRSPYR